MTYYLGFRQGPFSCQARIKGKDSPRFIFDPNAHVDICITLKAVLIGFLDEAFFASVLMIECPGSAGKKVDTQA
jgi:hypothetical protein